MKKILLGTTILVGTAVLAFPAVAQLEVSVGGGVEFEAGFWDNDLDDQHDLDFRTDSEIVIRADGVADNGLRYGAKVELEADQGSTGNSDEVVIYMSGDWGRIELGDEDGAADSMDVILPTVGNGGLDGSAAGTAWGGAFNVAVTNADSSDDTKITYYSPRFSGFQVGVSYAPTSSSGQTRDLTNNDLGQTDNNLEIGANYDGEFDGVGVLVGASFFTFNGETITPDGNTWSVGGQVSYGGFAVGGNYFVNDIDSLDTLDGFNVGATYEQDRFGVGVGFSTQDDVSDNDEQNVAFGLSGTYTIDAGLTASADLVFSDCGAEVSTATNPTSCASDDSTVFVTSVKASF